MRIDNMSIATQSNKLAEEYSSLFYSKLFSQVFDAIETDEMFGGGIGEEAFRSLLVDEYGKALAKNDPANIKAAISNELIKLQEVDYATEARF